VELSELEVNVIIPVPREISGNCVLKSVIVKIMKGINNKCMVSD
jgi:hypothetical protein